MPDRCALMLSGDGAEQQCQRRAGFGPGLAYCKSCTRVWWPECDTSYELEPLPKKEETETDWASRIFARFKGWRLRKEWPPGSCWLHRNNVGMYRLPKGKGMMPFGMGKGTSDWLGFKSIVVTPDLVGQRLAVFCAIEAKRDGKELDSRQAAFIEVVRLNGGISMRAAPENEDEVLAILTGAETPK